MKIRSIAFLIISLVPSIVFAGDYELYINNGAAGECGLSESASHSCYTSVGRAVCSADAIALELRNYFAGKEPKIPLLVPAFANGHVRFCSKEARALVSEVLASIEKEGPDTRGRHLKDFISVNKLQIHPVVTQG